MKWRYMVVGLDIVSLQLKWKFGSKQQEHKGNALLSTKYEYKVILTMVDSIYLIKNNILLIAK